MPPSLWQQIQSTADALQGVREGRSLTTLLERIPSIHRPGVQALTFHVLRNLGLAEALRSKLARRVPPPQPDAILCTSLALMSGGESMQYAPHTLVDQSVEAVKRRRETAKHASFINACLRRFNRERQQMMESVVADPIAKWNHPAWWIDQVARDHPAHWSEVLTAAQNQPPLTLRVNAQKTSLQTYRSLLAEQGIESHVVGMAGLQLQQARPVRELPGFEEGLFSVQDAAAQMAAPLLLETTQGTAPRVLDACAAPGGKTGHLLELRPDAVVTALDIDEKRCKLIEQNLARLRVRARIAVADASKPETWWDGALFDAILLDAPCTASGIVRRHPDVRWLRRESDIVHLAKIQANLLRVLWPLLRPGGHLLYCTCSIFRAEGEAQMQAFVAHNTDASELPSPGHLLPGVRVRSGDVLDNPMGEHDGFFYALLQKRVV